MQEKILALLKAQVTKLDPNDPREFSCALVDCKTYIEDLQTLERYGKLSSMVVDLYE